MRTRVSILLAALVAVPVMAQSVPPIARTKTVAQHAVNQTNAHTKTMTADQAATPTPAAEAPAPQRTAAAADVPPAATPKESAGAVSAPRPGATFEREVFAYERSGRRDPFVSLMSTSELRPLVSDLRLVAVALDPGGRNSVAVLRDVNTKEQYRIRMGQSLGRMRVSDINQKSVVFTIEEFGFSRQEILALGDSNKGSSK